MFPDGDILDFVLKELPKSEYKYHELHYTNKSSEHYVLEKVSSQNTFSFGYNRKKRDEVYEHDSYDTLYDDVWQDCEAYGVFVDSQTEPAAYLEISREEWNDRLRITNLLVRDEYRRCGIGRFLIEKAKEIAQNEDRRVITLETQSCNVPAIDFYLKQGFVFSGTNIYFYSNIDEEYDEIMIEMAYLY